MEENCFPSFIIQPYIALFIYSKKTYNPKGVLIKKANTDISSEKVGEIEIPKYHSGIYLRVVPELFSGM